MTGSCRRGSNLLTWCGAAACVAIGMFACVGTRLMADDIPAPWIAPDNAKVTKNPIAKTQQTLTEGAALFMDNCMICHGQTGRGDGPGAKVLNTKPADLVIVMAAETDGSLFWKITTGRGQMPAWKDTLSEAQRWKLVGYLRSFGETASTE